MSRSNIINQGEPNLTIKRELKAEINCPNCDELITLDAEKVDKGNIIRCSHCEKNTYYPFDRPWYQRRKLIIGYIISLVVTFLVGLAINGVYDWLVIR